MDGTRLRVPFFVSLLCSADVFRRSAASSATTPSIATWYYVPLETPLLPRRPASAPISSCLCFFLPFALLIRAFCNPIAAILSARRCGFLAAAIGWSKTGTRAKAPYRVFGDRCGDERTKVNRRAEMFPGQTKRVARCGRRSASSGVVGEQRDPIRCSRPNLVVDDVDAGPPCSDVFVSAFLSCPTTFFWVLPNSTRFYRVLLSFYWVLPILPGFTGFLPSFTGLKQCFIGFLPSFNRVYWFDNV